MVWVELLMVRRIFIWLPTWETTSKSIFLKALMASLAETFEIFPIARRKLESE